MYPTNQTVTRNFSEKANMLAGIIIRHLKINPEIS